MADSIVWGNASDRVYEGGVDRGVLYLSDGSHPWNGLISVDDEIESEEAKNIYVDGVKVYTRYTIGDYKATIKAYTAPEPFSRYYDNVAIARGLYITSYRRDNFAFSYRTSYTDANGNTNHLVYLIYNATAKLTNVSKNTFNDNPEATVKTWEVSTTPIRLRGVYYPAVVVLDTGRANKENLNAVLNTIYQPNVSYSDLISIDTIYGIMSADLSV